jgi:exosortase
VAVPALLWLWLFVHLHYDWTLNPQYNYGWAVPFLAGLLFYLRWQSRPEPDPPVRARIATVTGCALLAVLLPLRLIEEANPDWRLLSWTLAIVVVGSSLLTLSQIGGRSWAAHFAFPICFTLVAVPWLVQIENVVVQNLTGAVATAAVEIAGWSGFGAYRLGNIIQLHNGFVGVDEACSGVRTLQAAIMVSLFLGELLRLSAGRRMALVLASCLWMFLCNVARATALVVIGATRGLDVLEHWHDFIGTIVLVLGMAGLFLVAWLSQARSEESTAIEIERAPRPLRLVPVNNWVTTGAISWLAIMFAASELWYRAHERQLIERPRWEVQWSRENSTLVKVPTADTTRSILRFNSAASAAWQAPPGVRWWTFFARWNPGRSALQLVRSHSPDICLPAVGRTFTRELPSITAVSGDIELPFRVYEFEQEGKPLFVFVCIQEDKFAPAAGAVTQGWSAGGRLLAVWNGQRNLGQRLLEIAVSGFDDSAAAETATRNTVREIVARTSD